MAAQDFDATETPQDLVAALSLTASTTLRGAERDPPSRRCSVPRGRRQCQVQGTRAFRVEAGGPFTLKPAGDRRYGCWTDEAAVAVRLSWTESP